MVNIREEKKLIESLNGLKAISFICVFLSHSSILCFAGTGRMAVSLFLLISGFTFVYRYYDDTEIAHYNIMQSIKFAISKIKRLWLVHVVCSIIMFRIWYLEGYLPVNVHSIIGFILNVFCIGEWIPLKYRHFNGPDWYLSVCFFSYIVFPYVVRFLHRKGINRISIRRYLISSITIQLMLALCAFFFRVYIDATGWMELDISNWVVYFFPITRFIDFFIGCNLGMLYRTRDYDKEIKHPNIMELVLVGVLIAINYIYVYMIPFTTEKRAWTYVLLFEIATIPLVYYIALGNGIVSKLLTNKLLLILATISPWAFMIHYTVYGLIFYHYYMIGLWDYAIEKTKMPYLTWGFCITIIVSLFVCVMLEKVNTIREKH